MKDGTHKLREFKATPFMALTFLNFNVQFCAFEFQEQVLPGQLTKTKALKFSFDIQMRQ